MAIPSPLPSVDLDGLKCNPPKPSSLASAFDYLAFVYLPSKFPGLAGADCEDIANETLVTVMKTITEVRCRQYILDKAYYAALAIIRKRNRREFVSLDEGLESWESEDASKALNDFSISAWTDQLESEDLNERFYHAMNVVLARVPKQYADFVRDFLVFLRNHPMGTQREFAQFMGKSESNVNVTMKRVRDMVARHLKPAPVS